ncbi:MAG: type II secretion system F family protein [Candidatus Carbobacillus altaicus]|nr:type II secretion system F family protein [Candidatus Carbobacillus altaicus]
MTMYAYVARDRRGRRIRGRVEAETLHEVAKALQDQQLILLQARPINRLPGQEIYLTSPVKSREFVFFIRQLSTLVKSGVPIVRSLTLLTQDTRNKRFRSVLESVTTEVRAGDTLSQSFSRYPAFFPSFFVAMVRAGEASGQLDETLLRAADYFERQHTTREEIKSALTYPAVVLTLAILAVIFMFIFIIPGFVSLYDDLGVDVPLITRVLLDMSASLNGQWYYWLAGAVLFVTFYLLWYHRLGGALIVDRLKLRLPVVGGLVQKGAMALFARTMSTFYIAAVPLLQSLTITAQIVQNRAVAADIERARESLTTGRSLAAALQDGPSFTPLVVQMISVGEETGALEDVLGKIADFYEMEVSHTVSRLKALIEPLLIFFLAVVIGGMMLAIYIPLLTVYQNFG